MDKTQRKTTPKFLVLDSNAIIADFWLRSPSFALLRTFLSHAKTQLAIPEIVVQEVVNKHTEMVSKLKSDVRNVDREVASLLPDLKTPYFPKVVQAGVKAKYDDFLNAELSKMKAAVIPYGDIPHADVVARDLGRKRPFQQSGKGYRDTLLWETILRNCVQDDVTSVFISNNSYDFCGKDGNIHEDLKGDLKKANLELYPDLLSFTNAHIVPFLKERKEFETLIKNNKVPGLDIGGEVDKNIDILINAVNGSPEVLSDDPSGDEPEVDVIDPFSDFDILQASEISEDVLLIVFEFDAAVSFLFFVDRSDYAAMSEERTSNFHIVEPEWNEHVMQAETTTLVHFKCRLVFNTSEKETESFEVEEVNRPGEG